MSSIAELLALAGAGGAGLRRDAEVLLCHCLGRSRSFLYAWPERSVDAGDARRYREALAARRAGTPVAYLTGTREFWSLPLAVNDAVLIPRPETERVVEVALALALPESARVVDLGTGSGAIALALASERPGWQIEAVEHSPAALAVARANAARLDLERVRWHAGSWYAPLAGERFDLIVANPPYLAPDDPHLVRGDLRFEPRAALVAGAGGMAAIDAVLGGAPAHLLPGGWMLVEHGCEQGAAARDRLAGAGFTRIESWRDGLGHERVSGGMWCEGDAPGRSEC